MPLSCWVFFYKSFTLLNGSSHQTLNVLHLRFIFTSQLHKAGLQCCKAQIHLMLGWRRVRSGPACDIDVSVWDCVK